MRRVGGAETQAGQESNPQHGNLQVGGIIASMEVLPKKKGVPGPHEASPTPGFALGRRAP